MVAKVQRGGADIYLSVYHHRQEAVDDELM